VLSQTLAIAANDDLRRRSNEASGSSTLIECGKAGLAISVVINE